ncbi:MAG: hypothetical protein K0S47_2064 [Herbinix sp.]|jgi:hypothetical protein|nr:hypothetical protein [Herbinix sp.]
MGIRKKQILMLFVGLLLLILGVTTILLSSRNKPISETKESSAFTTQTENTEAKHTVNAETETTPLENETVSLETEENPLKETTGSIAFAQISDIPDNAVDITDSTKHIGRFLLTTEKNARLPYNVACSVGEDTISSLLPAGIDLSAVIPDFTYYGDKIMANGEEVISGITALDLRTPLELTLYGKDGSTKVITLTVESINTGLPSVSIVTADYQDITSKNDYASASFYMGGGNTKTCYYAMDDTDVLTITGGMKGRGNSSWKHPKKSYTIKLDDKAALLDMPASKDWALVANYEDYSLLRNYTAAYLGGLAGQKYIMKNRPVDAFLNGEYIGTYNLSEKIEIDENRVNITEFDANKEVSEVGYLMEFDAHVMEEFLPDGTVLPRDPNKWQQYGWKKTGGLFYNPETDETFFPIDIGGKWLTIKKPSTKNLTLEHGNYIYQKVTEAVFYLKSNNYENVSKRIDVESFVKWYLVEEYMNNGDSSMHSSVYMYLDADGKLALGPMWDFDRSSGNCDYWNYPRESVDDLYNSGAGWFKYLFHFKEARDILKVEWCKFVSQLDGLDNEIDQWADMISVSAKYNFEKWNILGTKVASNPDKIVELKTYEEQVDFLKNWLVNRKSGMDVFINSLN